MLSGQGAVAALGRRLQLGQPLRGGLRQRWHDGLEGGGPVIVRRELAPDETAINGFAEHRRFPEGKGLEPRQRFHVASAAVRVTSGHLRAREEPGVAVTGDVPSGLGSPSGDE